MSKYIHLVVGLKIKESENAGGTRIVSKVIAFENEIDAICFSAAKREEEEEKRFDINEFMKNEDNGLVEDGDFGLYMAWAGMHRGARNILINKLGYDARTVAMMMDNDVMRTLVNCQNLVPVAASYDNKIDEEVIFLVPKEVLSKCLVIQR